MRLSLVLFGLTVALASCISIPGDGIVHITGEILSSGKVNVSCTLSLLDAQDPSRQLYKEAISGKFAVNFIVPPKPRTYVVDLSCNETSLATKLVSRPQQQAAEFGRIALD